MTGKRFAPLGGHCMDEPVSTWPQLIEALFAHAWDSDLKRHRSPYVYRGCCEPAYELSPAITRLGQHHARVEKLLLSDFRQYASLQVDPGDSEWNWLAVAQHHGLPTRLLDWTYSPYVALHFMTAGLGVEEPATDGFVWCANYKTTNHYLPAPLRQKLADYRKSVFSIEALREAVANLDDFDTLSPEPFVVFLEPPSIDARIVNQVALFSIMSRPANRENSESMRLDDYLAALDARRTPEDSPVVRRLRIPAELKWEIRDRLDQANISERVLFPGLDGLSAWLRRHYTQRG
jgi:hypothetical protein